MLYFPVCQQQFARKSEKFAVYFYFCPSTLCLQARKAKGGDTMKERNNQNKNKNQNQENTNQNQNGSQNQNNQNKNNR
jgi:mannitol-specific phosphotransferase system IIBC component